jgi:phenylpropionate dioxygenase-like ring-hydroxylating dioxygenase large terminal subunit
MLDSDTPFLHGFWYLAFPGGRLKPGRTQAKVLLGEPVLIGRESGGGVFALRDICPHRGVPLSYGHFDGREVTCCYHGWRFAPDGRCTAIPSLTPDQDVHVDRIKTKSYPCREVQGNIWVYFAKNGGAQDEAPDPPPVPRVPDMDERSPQVSISSDFPCDERFDPAPEDQGLRAGAARLAHGAAPAAAREPGLQAARRQRHHGDHLLPARRAH